MTRTGGLGPIIVTGGSGFAGGHLVELLNGDGAGVVGWHLQGQAPVPGASGVRWMAIDMLDAGAVRHAIDELRPAVVYHCAGAAHAGHSWRQAGTTLEINVVTTHNLLRAIREAGLASRVLIPGSALVYRPSDQALTEESPLGPTNPYATSKLAQELLGASVMRDEGLPVFLTRSFNHIGPRQDASFSASSFARQIARIEAGLEPPVLRVGNLEAQRDLTDVRDVVRAYRAIVERGRPGRPYNVCSGILYHISDILQRLIGQARVPVDVQPDPERMRPSDTPSLFGNASRIRKETGWTPKIPIDDTLADLLEYCRAEVT